MTRFSAKVAIVAASALLFATYFVSQTDALTFKGPARAPEPDFWERCLYANGVDSASLLRENESSFKTK